LNKTLLNTNHQVIKDHKIYIHQLQTKVKTRTLLKMVDTTINNRLQLPQALSLNTSQLSQTLNSSHLHLRQLTNTCSNHSHNIFNKLNQLLILLQLLLKWFNNQSTCKQCNNQYRLILNQFRLTHNQYKLILNQLCSINHSKSFSNQFSNNIKLFLFNRYNNNHSMSMFKLNSHNMSKPLLSNPK
jgi:hypothetical protein